MEERHRRTQGRPVADKSNGEKSNGEKKKGRWDAGVTPYAEMGY
jgi:hypothetical protein